MFTLIALSVTLVLTACGSPPPPTSPHPIVVAANAPADDPVTVHDQAGADQRNAEIRPYIAKARASFPQAAQRFHRGLAAGENFFVSVMLRDPSGRFEQVFVAVDRIDADTISGRISSEVTLVRGYREGDPIKVAAAEIADWTISKPDGTEDGNFVGKYLESHR